MGAAEEDACVESLWCLDQEVGITKKGDCQVIDGDRHADRMTEFQEPTGSLCMTVDIMCEVEHTIRQLPSLIRGCIANASLLHLPVS